MTERYERLATFSIDEVLPYVHWGRTDELQGPPVVAEVVGEIDAAQSEA